MHISILYIRRIDINLSKTIEHAPTKEIAQQLYYHALNNELKALALEKMDEFKEGATPKSPSLRDSLLETNLMGGVNLTRISPTLPTEDFDFHLFAR